MGALDDVDVIVRKKAERFVAGIPQLGLFASGATAAEAVDGLEARKADLIASLEEAGELDLIASQRLPVARGEPVVVQRGGDLRSFAAKTGIVVIAVFAAFALSAGLLIGRVEGLVGELKTVKIGGAQFWGGLEKELDRLASSDSDLPEAKKQKLLADIRAITARWRPFVIELQSISSAPPPSRP